MTESGCTITRMDPGDKTLGCVGPPIACIEVKLVDVPEMNYLSTDRPHPRGEVCARGPSIFKGYYKDEAQTREAIDQVQGRRARRAKTHSVTCTGSSVSGALALWSSGALELWFSGSLAI